MLKQVYYFILLGVFALNTNAFEPSKDFRKLISEFSNVFNIVENVYVEPVASTQLMTHALKGMVSELDPHSEYLDEESLKDLTHNTSGQFGGLGIFIEYEKDQSAVRVVAPIEDTPAHRAGLKPGDLIIRADGQSFYGLSNREILSRLKGEPGTKVKLTIRRGNEIFEQPIIREIIKVTSVKYRWLEQEQGIAYVRITQFQTHTAKDLENALIALEDEQALKAVVLDMRNNPGGLLDSAVDVSDLFLEKGSLIVYYKRRSGIRKDYHAKHSKLLKGLRLAVLINEGSASASEIVAGALRQNNQALLVGRTTFGKGSVQSILPVSQNSAVKITTAFYYSPDDSKIQANGVKPDIEIGDYKLEPYESTYKPFREKSYAKHLKDTHADSTDKQPVEAIEKDEIQNPDDQSSDEKPVDPTVVPDNIKDDIFVFTATSALKGLLSSSN